MAQVLEFMGNHALLVGTFVVLLMAFLFNEMRRGGASVTAQELVNLVNRDQAVVLDVRDRKEFAAGHIVDAVNVERIMWASDFPHGDGTYPRSREVALGVTESMRPDQREAILYGNAAALYGS